MGVSGLAQPYVVNSSIITGRNLEDAKVVEFIIVLKFSVIAIEPVAPAIALFPVRGNFVSSFSIKTAPDGGRCRLFPQNGQYCVLPDSSGDYCVVLRGYCQHTTAACTATNLPLVATASVIGVHFDPGHKSVVDIAGAASLAQSTLDQTSFAARQLPAAEIALSAYAVTALVPTGTASVLIKWRHDQQVQHGPDASEEAVVGDPLPKPSVVQCKRDAAALLLCGAAHRLTANGISSRFVLQYSFSNWTETLPPIGLIMPSANSKDSSVAQVVGVESLVGPQVPRWEACREPSAVADKARAAGIQVATGDTLLLLSGFARCPDDNFTFTFSITTEKPYSNLAANPVLPTLVPAEPVSPSSSATKQTASTTGLRVNRVTGSVCVCAHAGIEVSEGVCFGVVRCDVREIPSHLRSALGLNDPEEENNTDPLNAWSPDIAAEQPKRNGRALLAYRFLSVKYSVSVKVKLHSPYSIVPTVINALYTDVAICGGAAIVQVQLSVRNTKAQFLRLYMTGITSIWSVQVDDVAVQPCQDADGVLVLSLRHGVVNQRVKLVYMQEKMPIPFIPGVSHTFPFSLPRFNAPIAAAFVRVHIPKTHAAADLLGQWIRGSWSRDLGELVISPPGHRLPGHVIESPRGRRRTSGSSDSDDSDSIGRAASIVQWDNVIEQEQRQQPVSNAFGNFLSKNARQDIYRQMLSAPQHHKKEKKGNVKALLVDATDVFDSPDFNISHLFTSSVLANAHLTFKIPLYAKQRAREKSIEDLIAEDQKSSGCMPKFCLRKGTNP